MKNILVPTDFSENALKASEYAAGLANRCGGRLHLVHAYILLENISGEGQSMRDAFNEGQIEKKKKSLLHHKLILAEKFPFIEAESHLFTGPTEEVLIQYSKTHEIDLVVMGTQGASGIAEVIFGSVTASLIGKSEIPVLAIPSGYTDHLPENIVLATQSFEQDKRVLDPVFEMAALYDVPVHVFVFESDSDSDTAIAQRALKLEQYLDFLQKTYPLARLKGTLNEGDHFERAMQEYSTEHKTGIICMLTHKRGFLGTVFHPSLTKKMAYQTRVPLLAIPVIA